MLGKISSFVEIQRRYGLDAAIISLANHARRNRFHDWCVETLWGFPADPNYELRIIHAGVDDITHTHAFPFGVRGPNAIVGVGGGNWDLMASEITDTLLYRSIEQRFEEGKAWEETPKYQRAAERIESGIPSWNNCISIDELRQRCTEIETLFEDMKANGYRSTLADEWTNSVQGVPVPDEIRIAIARDGRFIRCASARHRLAIANILGIDELPAIVQIEHREWDDHIDHIGRIRMKDSSASFDGARPVSRS